MPRLPRLPRRRPWWQRFSIKALQGAGGLAAGGGIGIAAMAVADTVSGGAGGNVLYAIFFTTVVGAGLFALRYGPEIVRAARRGRTPERHRHPSTRPQVRDRWIRGLSRRFRRG